MRIDRHPVLNFDRKGMITFRFDGKSIPAYQGETIAAALIAEDIRILSRSLRFHRPRGFFCSIGKCSSCMAEVDGVPNVKTCTVLAEDGMDVRSQTGWGQLQKLVSRRNLSSSPVPILETEIAVVGGGPAGLSAALYASRFGAQVMIFDENNRIGGQLIKQTHMFFGSKEHFAGIRGIDIGKRLLDDLSDHVQIFLNTAVIGYYSPYQLAVVRNKRIQIVKTKTIIVATGASENMLLFPNNDLPGVYGAGAVQTLMNLYGILPGNRVLMVGAGNIGLIVSYQLLQAGVKVVNVVEAMSRIGGYQVHASKIRRCGVPILTRHTIQSAYGKEKVEGAVIVQLDEAGNQIIGTEQDVAVDTICLAVGLKPASELLLQAGCRIGYIPELSGDVPYRNENLETSIEGIYVAGDVSGIEEASSAMLEGRLAGLDAVEKLKGSSLEISRIKQTVKKNLKELRGGPFGERIRIGEQKIRIGEKRI